MKRVLLLPAIRRYIALESGNTVANQISSYYFQKLEAQAKEVCESPLRAAVILHENARLRQTEAKLIVEVAKWKDEVLSAIMKGKDEVASALSKGKDEVASALLKEKDELTVFKQRLAYTQLLTSKIFQRFEF